MIHKKTCPHCLGSWETTSKGMGEFYSETSGFQVGVMTNLGMECTCYHCGSNVQFVKDVVFITPPNGASYSKKLEKD